MVAVFTEFTRGHREVSFNHTDEGEEISTTL